MKPLLLDILACPICKYFPLNLYILKWETPENKFSQILAAFNDKNIEILKNATKIRRGKDRIDDAVVITHDEHYLMRDEIVRKASNIQKYLEELEPKFENFTVIQDFTEENYSKCLHFIKSEIIKTILQVKAELEKKSFENISFEKEEEEIKKIQPEIYVLNWFLQFSEIEEGIIYCEKCSRWYPIIETIPQMLPDELREREAELRFLQKWKVKAPENILKKGKPFNLED